MMFGTTLRGKSKVLDRDGTKAQVAVGTSLEALSSEGTRISTVYQNRGRYLLFGTATLNHTFLMACHLLAVRF